jgi:hypothetical protein
VDGGAVAVPAGADLVILEAATGVVAGGEGLQLGRLPGAAGGRVDDVLFALLPTYLDPSVPPQP